MGSRELRERDKWQDGANASTAERNFYEVFKEALSGTDLIVRPSIGEFSTIYVDVNLPDGVLSEIYRPTHSVTKHGIRPDYAIENIGLNKRLYIEVKRQDGWVEGKPRSAGRGNAHERSCKYFTPGLLDILRAKGGLGNDALPFWTVFQGDIARDPCRVREITLWYAEYSGHFFMWRNPSNPGPLVEHFNTHLRHLLF